MADVFGFTDNTTDADAEEFNKLINRSHTNLLVNSEFESWVGEGTSSPPDGWVHSDSQGSTIARADTAAGYPGWGYYLVAVTHTTTGTDALYQNLGGAFRRAETFDGEIFSLGVNVKAGVDDKIRAYLYDGNTYTYSSYATTSWGRISVQKPMSSPSTFYAGVTIEGESGTSYIGDFMVTRGATIPKYSPSPTDRSLVCSLWDDDGSVTPLRGCRLIPFSFQVAVAGETEKKVFGSQTLPTGLGGHKILSMLADVSGTTSGEEYQMKVHFYNFSSGTGYDMAVTCCGSVATTLPTATLDISGHAIVAGWDNSDWAHR